MVILGGGEFLDIKSWETRGCRNIFNTNEIKYYVKTRETFWQKLLRAVISQPLQAVTQEVSIGKKSKLREAEEDPSQGLVTEGGPWKYYWSEDRQRERERERQRQRQRDRERERFLQGKQNDKLRF